MRPYLAFASFAFFASALACGGGSSSYSTPTAPTTTGGGATSSANTTIAIVANRAAQSFSPNPSNAGQGTTVAWQNSDTVTHHIVMNDGSLDTGDIPPGGTSRALALATNGGNYHCTIHPTMVGTINTSAGTSPPCTGLYCDSNK